MLLLVGITVLSALFAVRGYTLAFFLVVIGTLVILLDLCSISLLKKTSPKLFPPATPIRRFWLQASRPRNPWLSPTPLVWATVYTEIFVMWNLPLWMMFTPRGIKLFFDGATGLGISIRVLTHSVNALVLAYLLVHLVGTLTSRDYLQRRQKAGILAAMILVAMLHFAIF
ncbi:MAG: hypothetical protein COA78_24030 [Blastopirellula sp.]|nr:MAG: hypothetical protein COA78_24030 [Blastopirellula sp.]